MAAIACCAAVLTACSAAAAVPAIKSPVAASSAATTYPPDPRPHPSALPRVTARSSDPPPLRLMVVGDSLSTGFYASTAPDTYVNVLAAGLHAVVASNNAVPGYTVAQDLVLAQRAPQTAAGLLIVESSTNDALQHVPPARTAGYYPELLATAKAKAGHARLVCLGAWQPRAVADRYDAVTAPLCRQAGGVFVPLSGIYDTPGTRGRAGVRVFLGTRDGMHPNDQGHRSIAAAIIAVLR